MVYTFYRAKNKILRLKKKTNKNRSFNSGFLSVKREKNGLRMAPLLLGGGIGQMGAERGGDNGRTRETIIFFVMFLALCLN